MKYLTPAAMTVALAAAFPPAHAQETPAVPAPGETTLAPVVVKASADASAEGLSKTYPGGQVARGGRAGILGTKDNLATPFSITSYTNELIQDRQAKSVGDVLQNDPGVRMARGFGNFQESYFIRGFLLGSDDVSYNGLYSLLPRQYIATELFERVEVLHGATAFLTGANPGSGGIGGAINLLPKRAPNEDLTRVTVGASGNVTGTVAADVARRFGPDQATGIRVNAAYRDGQTGVDDEKAKLGLLSVGLDWRSRDVRLSGDIGYQENRLKQTRPNVSVSAISVIPAAPESDANFAQPWSYSNERDLFGTLRGEFDITKNITAWAAYGLRRSEEANALANLDLTAGGNGAATFTRFDNTRKDSVDTGELGLRGKLKTGAVGHEWVVSASLFEMDKKTAYAFDSVSYATNLYAPTFYAAPAFTSPFAAGNNLDSPALTNRTKLSSLAVGDTLSMLDETVLVTLGLRRQRLEVTDYAYNGGTPTGYDRSRNSPLAGIVYRVTPTLSVYGNYIEGLSQGETAPTFVFVGTPPTNGGQSLDPYVSRQKEVGVKFEAGKLGGEVALFATKKPRNLTNAANVYTSEGKDEHRGIELKAYGQALPGLKLLGGVTWLDAEQKKTGTANDGNQVIGVPRMQANLGTEWNVTGLQGLAVDARVVHTGSVYADSANTLKVRSWTRLDLGVRYEFDLSGRLVTLRGRVDNVTDRNYWASAGGYPEAGYLVVGSPRTFNLSASVDF